MRRVAKLLYLGARGPHVRQGQTRLASGLRPPLIDLQFQLAGITFVPFYAMGFQQPYQMYFDLQG